MQRHFCRDGQAHQETTYRRSARRLTHAVDAAKANQLSRYCRPGAL